MIEKPDREKMRAKAETALRREWRHVVHGFDDLVEFTPMKDYSGELTPANAAHIVAFQPQAALQLLDQIDELEAMLATEREAVSILKTALAYYANDPSRDESKYLMIQ